jgi:small subunit ribosomal protein S20
MANIKSAKKRISVIAKKTAINKSRKSALKTAEKRFNEALLANDVATATEKLVYTEKKLMQAGAKGTIHKKAASRKVSRLAKRLNASTAE